MGTINAEILVANTPREYRHSLAEAIANAIHRSPIPSIFDTLYASSEGLSRPRSKSRCGRGAADRWTSYKVTSSALAPSIRHPAFRLSRLWLKDKHIYAGRYFLSGAPFRRLQPLLPPPAPLRLPPTPLRFRESLSGPLKLIAP